MELDPGAAGECRLRLAVEPIIDLERDAARGPVGHEERAAAARASGPDDSARPGLARPEGQHPALLRSAQKGQRMRLDRIVQPQEIAPKLARRSRYEGHGRMDSAGCRRASPARRDGRRESYTIPRPGR